MTTRKAVPLTSDEIAAIETEHTRSALVQLVGPDAVRSEASTLHALVVLGLEQVKEHTALQGYAALAAAQDEDDVAYRQALRGRRRGGEDEE